MADGSWQRRAVASAAAFATFALTWVVLAALNGPEPSLPGGAELSRASEADIRALQADGYLQQLRETGDGALYDKAERALRGVRGSSAAETARGTLALVRHDFEGGLRHGLEARRLAPDVVRPLGVIADAQVELGRYDDAALTLQQMVDLKPNLAAYARVSYFRELHGDLSGAAEAMRLATSAGGETPENVAYVQALAGNLAFDRGRLEEAGLAYRTALARLPDHPGARRGLARLDAARGEWDPALRTQRDLAGAPGAIPEDVIALGEYELAAGQTAAGRRTLEQAREVLRAEAIAGTGNANERALVEADFGDRAAAVRLGRRGWKHAPSIVSADALGWAYTRAGEPEKGLAWARRALKTGSLDRQLLYHAGIAARDAGKPGLARRWLARAVEGNPRFSPLHGARAERALATVQQGAIGT